MNLSDYIAIYLALSYLMMFWCAHVMMEIWPAIWASLMWPLTLVIMILYSLTTAIWDSFFPLWEIDIVPRGMDHHSRWGTRKPGDKPGIAFRCPLFELQFWKRIK